jgi:flavin-dependent dehydrogenase
MVSMADGFDEFSETVDVLVAGGGPAGAAAALTLASRGRRVLLVEATRYDAPRVGESLSPRVHPLLREMGVDPDLRALEPLPSYGTASVWGSDEVQSQSFVFSPYGPGWHVDRRRVDQALAAAAVRAGARVVTGVHVSRVEAEGDGGWRIDLHGGPSPVRARALVDATGRAPALARWLGARRVRADRLAGAAVHFGGAGEDRGGFPLVEAVEEGWWYSAPLPGGGMVVIYMTDADLLARRAAARAEGWHQSLAGTRHTAARCAGLRPVWGPRVFSALSHTLRRPAPVPRGAPWLAAGDARAAMDPLSSSGVPHALQGGRDAGEAIHCWLDGDPAAAAAYEQAQERAFTDYLPLRAAYYAMETRWPGSSFWRRRTPLANSAVSAAAETDRPPALSHDPAVAACPP